MRGVEEVLQEIAVGSLAHPVGVVVDGQEGGPAAKLAEEFALDLGVGGRAWFAGRNASPNQANAYIGGLGPGTIGKEEVAEGDGVGNAERGLRIFVALLDAIFEIC